MLYVDQIWDSARTIFGHNKEAILLRQISDSVQLLANKGEIDPLVGYVDLCVTENCATLPREVESILACNIGGHPALGRDELFSFHLNGQGDFTNDCHYTWTNTGNFPTYRDLACPALLVSFLDRAEDTGVELRVFGFDNQNKPLRTEVNGVWSDGYVIPTIYNVSVPAEGAPTIGRITGIRKGRSVGNIRLSTFDNSSSSGTLLGVFEPDETDPQYRRIKLSRNCGWVRLCFRRRTLELVSQSDRIYLHSRLSLLLAMRALKKYEEANIPEALQFEAHATRILTEKENVIQSAVSNPIQISDRATALGIDQLN